jgi:hypothetical protein
MRVFEAISNNRLQLESSQMHLLWSWLSTFKALPHLISWLGPRDLFLTAGHCSNQRITVLIKLTVKRFLTNKRV